MKGATDPAVSNATRSEQREEAAIQAEELMSQILVEKRPKEARKLEYSNQKLANQALIQRKPF